MEKNIKVSIIVPVYNSSKYLSECLDSLINQTYNNIEIICINDGSTDDSLSILNKYAREDNRIIIIDQSNNGTNIARRNGIEKATGDYLMFVDSDDYILNEAIDILVKHVKKNNLDIVKFNFINLFPGKVEYGFYSNKKDLYNLLLTTVILNNITSEIVSKRIINLNDDIFKIKTSNGEDLLMNLSFYNNAKGIQIIEDKLYYYRPNENSTTKTINIDRILSFIPEIDILMKERIRFARIWGIYNNDIINIIRYNNIKAICLQVIKALSTKLDDEVTKKINEVLLNLSFNDWNYKYLINKYEKNIFYRFFYLNICKRKYKIINIITRIVRKVK